MLIQVIVGLADANSAGFLIFFECDDFELLKANSIHLIYLSLLVTCTYHRVSSLEVFITLGGVYNLMVLIL